MRRPRQEHEDVAWARPTREQTGGLSACRPLGDVLYQTAGAARPACLGLRVSARAARATAHHRRGLVTAAVAEALGEAGFFRQLLFGLGFFGCMLFHSRNFRPVNRRINWQIPALQNLLIQPQ